MFTGDDKVLHTEFEIKNVVKKFDSNIALDRLNIHVKDSSIYGLVGINGAGKTTIIKEIMGIQNIIFQKLVLQHIYEQNLTLQLQ